MMSQTVQEQRAARASMNAEKWRLGPVRLDRNQRGKIGARGLWPNKLSELFDGGSLEQNRDWQIPGKCLRDPEKQLRGLQRVDTQLKNVRLNSDWPDVQHLFP